MILFSIGLSTPFADWCDAVAARLAQRALGEIALLGANSAAELASGMVRCQSPNVLVSSRHPTHWLRQLLTDTGTRFVLALDDPRTAVATLVANAQSDGVEATRIVASTCAAISQCLELPDGLALVLRPEVGDPGALAAAIAGHLGLAVAEPDLEAIVAELAAAGVAPTSGADPEALLAEPHRGLINAALSAYVERFRGNPLGEIVWSRELFFTNDHQPVTQAIDITGRSRFLIDGPHIKIPPGQWTADVFLAFSEEAAITSYSVDVTAGAQLALASVQPPKEGLFPVSLSFEIDEANENQVEIRVKNERAALDGRLALMAVTLTSKAEKIPQAVLENWARELGLVSPA